MQPSDAGDRILNMALGPGLRPRQPEGEVAAECSACALSELSLPLGEPPLQNSWAHELLLPKYGRQKEGLSAICFCLPQALGLFRSVEER